MSFFYMKNKYTKSEKRLIARGENKWIIRNAGKSKALSKAKK